MSSILTDARVTKARRELLLKIYGVAIDEYRAFVAVVRLAAVLSTGVIGVAAAENTQTCKELQVSCQGMCSRFYWTDLIELPFRSARGKVMLTGVCHQTTCNKAFEDCLRGAANEASVTQIFGELTRRPTNSTHLQAPPSCGKIEVTAEDWPQTSSPELTLDFVPMAPQMPVQLMEMRQAAILASTTAKPAAPLATEDDTPRNADEEICFKTESWCKRSCGISFDEFDVRRGACVKASMQRRLACMNTLRGNNKKAQAQRTIAAQLDAKVTPIHLPLKWVPLPPPPPQQPSLPARPQFVRSGQR